MPLPSARCLLRPPARHPVGFRHLHRLVSIFFTPWVDSVRQSWQVLKTVLLVFPPVPGMSWTADSGRLWSLRLAWCSGTIGSNLGDGRFDGRMVSIQFWSVGWSSKRKGHVASHGSHAAQESVSRNSLDMVEECLRSVSFPSWDHWVFRAAWLIWLLAASCSGCLFRTRQGYDTAVIVARKGGWWKSVWRHFGHQTWTAEKSPSKMEVCSWDNIQMESNGYKWGIFHQLCLLDEFSWARRFT